MRDTFFTASSAGAGISITDGRGAVAGAFAVSGNEVTFQPRGSLCFDQRYQVSVSTQVKTSDGVALDASKTFEFSIPDGAWADPRKVDTSATLSAGFPVAATDEAGNAIVARSSPSPLVNYYDSSIAAWNGPVAPTFTSGSSSSRILAAALNGRAMVYHSGYGIAECSSGSSWAITAESALLGTATHLYDGSLALNGDGSAIQTWDNQSGYDPGNVFAAIRAKGQARGSPRVTRCRARGPSPHTRTRRQTTRSSSSTTSDHQTARMGTSLLGAINQPAVGPRNTRSAPAPARSPRTITSAT